MDEKEKTIEEQVADTMLQTPKKVQIGKRAFYIAPPTLATLIKASAYVSQLPNLDVEMDAKDMLPTLLGNAEKLQAVSGVLATLILGAKRIDKSRRHWWQVWREKDPEKRLREYLENEARPTDLAVALMQIIKGMQLADFFLLTVSLKGLNVAKRTKETVTTARGV